MRQSPGRRSLPIAPPAPDRYTWKGYLFLLADGVGGRVGGEEASALAIAQAARRYYDDPSDDLATSLRRAVEATNRDLRRRRAEHPDHSQMATTLTAAVTAGDRLYLAHVGDSRAYLWRAGGVWLLTGDHSWRERQRFFGVLTAAQIDRSPQRSQITRSLGSRDQAAPDLWEWQLEAGDRLLLCSDGLSGPLSADELSRLIGLPDLDDAAEALVDTAFDNGSSDNASLILVELQAAPAADHLAAGPPTAARRLRAAG